MKKGWNKNVSCVQWSENRWTRCCLIMKAPFADSDGVDTLTDLSSAIAIYGDYAEIK